MKYCTTVIAVRDMEKSLQFYKDLFQQDVLVDFGKNKTLTCGLALQQGLEHIAGFDASTMKFRSNTMELYFETEDFMLLYNCWILIHKWKDFMSRKLFPGFKEEFIYLTRMDI